MKDNGDTELTKNEGGLTEIEGIVERIIYRNDENGYAVCEIATEGDELVTAVGILPGLGEGEAVKAYGSWDMHPTYGRQLKIEYFEKQLPASAEAILRYLSSRAVKGIGPATAARIVEKYGVDSFDVIENHPEWIADLPGITLKKAEQISESFKQQFGIRSVMMFCRDFLGTSAAVRVYKKWGGSAVDVIKENPYLLCDEIFGVGFERADRIAQSVGFKAGDERRIMAGIQYVLKYNAAQNGHVYLPEDKLLSAVAELLEVSRDDADIALERLTTEHKVCVVKLGKRRCVYLTRYFEAERYIAEKLELLERVCPRLNMEDIGKFIDQIESESGIEYAAMQRRAITDALSSGVMLLTGGPGTGKTTVIRAVIRVFERLGSEIALAAPTGRAAKRMSEATSHEAKTIHRMLEMEFTDDDFPRFNRDEKNLLDEDVVIIDEASMVDTQLMASLLRAIKPGARIIMIGDADQLPSVGAGNVLNDLIDSDKFPTVKLKEIFRQAKESLIIINAHEINNGGEPNLTATDSDFFFLTRNAEDKIAPTVCDLCLNRLPRSYGEEIRDKIQVITPSRKGIAGTERLNFLLQNTLNPPAPGKREKKSRDIVFRVGDKVMQVKNNYDIEWTRDGREGVGVFNGDIGVIEDINASDESVRINFDERVANYDYSMLDELEHAYAITIHKSQGSEYPVVIMPVYDYSPKLLTRNLLYTAVTRAQQMVIMVGRQDVLTGMIANNRQTLRYTGLLPMLLGEFSEAN